MLAKLMVHEGVLALIVAAEPLDGRVLISLRHHEDVSLGEPSIASR